MFRQGNATNQPKLPVELGYMCLRGLETWEEIDVNLVNKRN